MSKRVFVIGIILLFILGAFLLAVFFLPKSFGDSSSKNTLPDVTYRCDGGKEIRAQFSDADVSFELSDGRSFTLQRTPLENEDAFSNRDGTVILWVKDYGAFLEESEESTYTGCTVYPLTFPSQ